MIPKFSIIMNCYNGEQYLRQAIDSIYAQTFTDWEIVLWDNASTDATAEIARSYDERLRYFCSEKTVPLGAARKAAMKEVRGEWIGFLDCDDYWYPNKLERQEKSVDGGEFVLCYAGIAEINPDGSLIREVIPKYKSGTMLEQQLLQFEINMVTPIIKKDVLDQYNLGFDENITASEEYNLFIRLMAKGAVCAIPEVLGVWRISPGSLTDRQISKWSEERFYTLNQLKSENPGIELQCPGVFKEAYARGSYYKARYLMSIGKRIQAFKVLSGIATDDIKYAVLAISLFIPGLWSLIHKPVLKRKLLPKILGIAKTIKR